MRATPPLGVRALSFFFGFGTLACVLTIAALLLPGSLLDQLWRLNTGARVGFHQIGTALSIILMAAVGLACAGAAIGLNRMAEWGRRLALAILSLNLAGDSLAAWLRHDPRTLIGLPIGGTLLFYLLRMKGHFKSRKRG
jgi:hypothetical protein